MTCPIKRKIEIRPKFHQADMMGVIHNVEYFQWFEEGRLQIMLEILSMDEAMRLDIAMPVVENFCSYKCPSRFGDVLTLYTTHSRLDVYEGRLRFDHLLVNSNNRKEIAMIQKKEMTVSLSFPLIITLINPASFSLPCSLGKRRKVRENINVLRTGISHGHLSDHTFYALLYADHE